MMKEVLRKLAKAVRLARIKIYRHGLLHGVGAAIEHEAVLAFLSQNSFTDVVDVGANCGQFSLLCRRWFPHSIIHAFEPLQQPAEKFKEIFGKDPDTRLIQAAIGTHPSEQDMHVSKAMDSSSLLPIGPTQSEIFPGTEESHTERVRVAPLDAFVNLDALSARALLKIDVQGYELGVLRGCETLFDRFAAVYVECSFVELYEGQALAHEVIDWLHARGFFLARIGMVTFDKRGMSVQGDFLFLREDALSKGS